MLKLNIVKVPVIANSNGAEPKEPGQPAEFPRAAWGPDDRQLAFARVAPKPPAPAKTKCRSGQSEPRPSPGGQQLPLDHLVPVGHHPAMLSEIGNRFSFTRAASKPPAPEQRNGYQ